ncbi:MAG: hypothetical protein H3C62_02890 [Gemmatimonadaceae bacterium]|nr:hypothetical protein [Gemmatimonadaceae bacterium]
MNDLPRDLDGLDLYGDVLSAYRRDLERTPDVVRFGDDVRWLRAALQVEQLVSQPERGNPQRLRKLGGHNVLQGRALLGLTEKMEAAGAVSLAFATLSYARRVWERTDPASCGTAIFRQARICRTVGATRAAENYYSLLSSHAARHRLPELRGRALVGFGLLRTLDGNLPAGRRWFVKARSVSGNHPVASAVAYHGEMNAALAQHDFSGALVAGWRALELAALPAYDQAGVLVNLASIALRVGRPQAALRSVRQALRRSKHPRVRLGAFAKGAAAAAAMGDLRLVNRYATQLAGVASKVNIPFEELEARSELAEALSAAGERSRAHRLARRVRDEARPHHFTQVVQRCDRILRDAPREAESVSLTGAASRVVAALETV